jgi:hypothetical protein
MKSTRCYTQPKKQAAQETGGPSKTAVQQMMMRLMENLSIPTTTGSPILLSNIDAKDIRQAKSWPSSLVEYVNREGCAIGRLGKDQWGTNDERIPRPIAGTPDGGEIQWSREYDVQTNAR